MKGLSSKAAKSIERLIKNKFDALSLSFLGLYPKKSKEKHITFTTARNSLMSLFLQALGTRKPSRPEEQTLKLLMSVANGYIDSLQERTTSRVVHELDSYVRERNIEKKPVSVKKINSIINDNMNKAKSHFEMIANTETNKAVNLGTALQINKIAEQKGQKDPTVFFVVTHDDRTGDEEYVLHTLPDKRTPRVWKLSEIGHGYHKPGDPNPKFPGLHPNCRCKLTYLASGWGFDKNGQIKYIGPDWDELEYQRDKYGKPR